MFYHDEMKTKINYFFKRTIVQFLNNIPKLLNKNILYQLLYCSAPGNAVIA